jgi:hypothetical protein
LFVLMLTMNNSESEYLCWWDSPSHLYLSSFLFSWNFRTLRIWKSKFVVLVFRIDSDFCFRIHCLSISVLITAFALLDSEFVGILWLGMTDWVDQCRRDFVREMLMIWINQPNYVLLTWTISWTIQSWAWWWLMCSNGLQSRRFCWRNVRKEVVIHNLNFKIMFTDSTSCVGSYACPNSISVLSCIFHSVTLWKINLLISPFRESFVLGCFQIFRVISPLRAHTPSTARFIHLNTFQRA